MKYTCITSPSLFNARSDLGLPLQSPVSYLQETAPVNLSRWISGLEKLAFSIPTPVSLFTPKQQLIVILDPYEMLILFIPWEGRKPKAVVEWRKILNKSSGLNLDSLWCKRMYCCCRISCRTVSLISFLLLYLWDGVCLFVIQLRKNYWTDLAETLYNKTLAYIPRSNISLLPFRFGSHPFKTVLIRPVVYKVLQ